jgi:D-alanine-D-alanine ligase
MSHRDRLRVAVLFGGKSLEHEISVVSAYQVMEAFDSARYEIVPIYIDSNGLWYTGDELRSRKSYLPGARMKAQLHRVSLIPGQQLELQPLGSRWTPWKKTQLQPIDVIFPVLHGSFGEDGCLQGMLEVLGCPYVGSGPMASSVAMNKAATKAFAASLGVPTLPGVCLHRRNWDPTAGDAVVESILQRIRLPVIVKPSNLGSSIGVTAAHSAEQLLMNLAAAFVLDHEVLVEPLIEDLAEYNVAVMGPRGNGAAPRCSAIERPRRLGSVLSFEQKYLRGPGTKKVSRSFSGMADLSRDLNPKDSPAELMDQVRAYASTLFEGLGLRGTPRFDFLYDRQTAQIYMNEINPMPGSLSFYLWEAADPRLGFTELLHELVQEALREFSERNRSQRSTASRIFHSEPANR